MGFCSSYWLPHTIKRYVCKLNQMKVDGETRICSFKSLVFIYIYIHISHPPSTKWSKNYVDLWISEPKSNLIVHYDEETLLSFCFTFHRQTPISEMFISKRTAPPFSGVWPVLHENWQANIVATINLTYMQATHR